MLIPPKLESDLENLKYLLTGNGEFILDTPFYPDVTFDLEKHVLIFIDKEQSSLTDFPIVQIDFEECPVPKWSIEKNIIRIVPYLYETETVNDIL